MSSIILKPSRAYPSIPEVGNTVESHTRALRAIVEAIQIHERRTLNLRDSFIRVRDLEETGIVDVNGNLMTSAVD